LGAGPPEMSGQGHEHVDERKASERRRPRAAAAGCRWPAGCEGSSASPQYVGFLRPGLRFIPLRGTHSVNTLGRQRGAAGSGTRVLPRLSARCVVLMRARIIGARSNRNG
jgi:hypothetical protein